MYHRSSNKKHFRLNSFNYEFNESALFQIYTAVTVTAHIPQSHLIMTQRKLKTRIIIFPRILQSFCDRMFLQFNVLRKTI